MKSLKRIQTLAKIGKIFSKIVFICYLVVLVIFGLVLAGSLAADTDMFQVGSATVHGLMENPAEGDMKLLYPLAVGGTIFMIGQAIVAKFAERYFAHELKAGTPFTKAGAKELFRLGILTICIPLGAIILAQIGGTIAANWIGCSEMLKIESGENVALGVTFIVVSLICQYGAELQASKNA